MNAIYLNSQKSPVIPAQAGIQESMVMRLIWNDLFVVAKEIVVRSLKCSGRLDSGLRRNDGSVVSDSGATT